MKMRFLTLLLYTMLSFLFAVPSFAGSSIRCGNNLVSVGDPKIKILDKCGEPITKDEIEINPTFRRNTYRFIEQWTYSFHYGYYDILHFKGGKLIKIDPIIPK